jgi:glycosyltransferase involved in cell wall biosynthesis
MQFAEPFRSLSKEQLEVSRGIFVWRRDHNDLKTKKSTVTFQKQEPESSSENALEVSWHSSPPAKQLKIAFLSYEYPPETGFGGIGTYTWYQARALAKMGHEVHVLSGATEPSLLRMSEQDGVRVYRFHDNGLLMRGFQYLSKYRLYWTQRRLETALCMFRAFSSLHRKHHYDLVEMPECGAEGMLINHWIRPKTIVKFHSPCELIMQYYDSRKTDIRICSLLERFGMHGATAYTTPSSFLAKEAAKTFRIQKPIRVIPYGIDLELFDQQEPADIRRQLGIPKHRPIILFSSRMEQRKGIHLCKEIVHSILSRYDVSFLFAGQDLFGYMEGTLLPFWNSQQYRGSVHYLGRVTLSMIRSCLRQAQILLLPSIWDNTPYSCMEAMSARCAIVGTNHGGVPELIEHEISGLLAKTGDPQSYISAIERLLEDEVLRDRLGTAARRRIEESFNDRHIAKISTDFYLNVLEEKIPMDLLPNKDRASIRSAEGT